MSRTSWLALPLLSASLAGCFDPATSIETTASGSSTETTGSTTEDPSISTTETTTSETTTSETTTTASTGPTTTTTTTTTDTTSGSTGGSGSTGAPAECMNGIAEAGELCLGSVIVTEPVNPVEKIANGDMDGNNVLDVVTSEGGDAEAAFYFGAGDGTFPGYAGEAFSPVALDVAVGFFNNDTDPDVVMGLDSDTENIGIILGDGAGTFPAQFPTYGTVAPGFSVAVADIDGNGFDDVAVATQVPPSVGQDGRFLAFLSSGNGSGNFGAPVVSSGPDGNYRDVITGDWTGNGVVDIAVTFLSPTNSSFIRACRGNNSGSFANNVCETVDGGAQPRALAAGDFNGDGDQDIAASQSMAAAVLVFPGNGTGTFGAPTTIATADTSWGIAAGDLDNDGVDDIVATHPVPATASVILGDDFGSIDVDTILDVEAPGYIPEDVTLGDFNDDGALDVVLGMRGSVSGNPGIAAFISDV